MFELKFTLKDLVRSLWAALAGALAVLAAELQAGKPVDWRVLLGMFVAGVGIAIKNGILADGTTLKG